MRLATRLIETGSIDIEAIKDQHPLASIVDGYVALKRKKDRLEGLCPFHQERTASFNIFEKDQRYHCFGCGAHGDVFDFLEAIDGLDLRAAAERITGGSYPVYSPERIEELRAKRAAFEAEEAARQESAIIGARERWIGADPSFFDHPYLEKKGIQAHGIRRDGDLLLIPLLGPDAKPQTLQTINKDGRKLFIPDAPVSGGLFVIGGKVATSETPVLLCEGFATGATLHEATGLVTVCAFSAENMVKVAERLIATYPGREYVVAGDDDRGKTRNAGREKAIAAAAILKCRAMFPVFPTDEGSDFNDMASAYSLKAVRELIIDGVLPDGEPAPENLDGLLAFEWFDRIDPQLDANWLVDDLIPQQGLCLVYGHPGSGKSFFALDIAMHVALAREWRHRPVERGLVIYIGAEGQRGLRQRISAFKQHNGLTELPFVLIPVEVDLLTGKEDVAALIATIHHCAARFSIPIAMMVIDTLSRTFGGGDEAGPDMAAYVNNVGKVQAEFQCSAVIIHHRPKDSANETPRGHGSLWGACDTILLVEDLGTTKQVKNTKQKDAELSAAMLFNLKVIELGEDGKGKLVTSCVVEPADGVAVQTGSSKKLTSGQRITLEQLGLTIETNGISVPSTIPENALNRVTIGKVVALTKWRERTLSALAGPDTSPDSADKAFRRNRNRLQELDIIGVYGEYAWLNY